MMQEDYFDNSYNHLLISLEEKKVKWLVSFLTEFSFFNKLFEAIIGIVIKKSDVSGILLAGMYLESILKVKFSRTSVDIGVFEVLVFFPAVL
jgi:hypothetical protein